MVLASTAVARSAVTWHALTASMLLVRLVVHRNGRCRLQNATRHGATFVCKRAEQAQFRKESRQGGQLRVEAG